MDDTMNITSVTHAVEERTGANRGYCVVIDGEEYYVPLKSENRFYQAVQAWVADGNTIQDAS